MRPAPWFLSRRAVSSLRAGLFEELTIDLGLRRGEVAEGGLLDARGQVLGHVLFQAAQEHGTQAAREAFTGGVGGGVGGAREGQFVAFAEVPALAEVTGQREVHDRPQVAHGVFHGGARQHEAVLAAERASRLGDLAVGVFNVVSLVETDAEEVVGAVFVEVAPQEGVAGDDEVGSGDLREERGAVGAVDGEGAEFGREAGSLAPPVLDEGGRADDEGRMKDEG